MHGADAVYIGADKFGARASAGNSIDEIKRLCDFAHIYYAKVYVTVNTILKDSELEQVRQMITELYRIGVDGLIVQDMSIAEMDIPPIELHASTQTDNRTADKVKFFEDIGFTRVVLARELSLQQIKEIHDRCNVELEVFVHGALCIAVSGRCLISGLLSRRDANVGTCNNSCRWNYRTRDLHLEDAVTTERLADAAQLARTAIASQSASAINPLDERDQPALRTEIEETVNREGQWMPMEEDEHGSYLMNSRDLCALPVLKRLMEIGVDSLKIEGRSRSPFYAGAVSRAYRLAIDALSANPEAEIPEESWTIVRSIPARGYTTALLEPHDAHETQDYGTNVPNKGYWQVVGQVESQENGSLYIRVKNRFTNTSKLMVYTPHGAISLDGSTLRNKQGAPTDVAPGDGHFVYLDCAQPVDIRTAVLLRDDH